MNSFAKAEVLIDSINPYGYRLLTTRLKLPQIILGELTRHRNFAFSVESSRAVNIQKVMQNIENEFYIPRWTRNRKGMTGEFITDRNELFKLQSELYEIYDRTKVRLNSYFANVHKQDAAQYLKPFQYIDAIVTGTEDSYNEMLELRCPKNYELDADFPAHPAFQELALCIQSKISASEPRFIDYGEWHKPVDQTIEQFAAFAARRSYNIDTSESIEQTNQFVTDKLIKHKHWSPFEHCNRVATIEEIEDAMLNNGEWLNKPVVGRWQSYKGIYASPFANAGYIQHRKLLENA